MKNYSTVKNHFEENLIKFPTINHEIVLNRKNICIQSVYEDDNYIGFYGVSQSKEGYCKKCGQVLYKIKQYKTTYTTFAKYNSKNIVLKLKKKMYYCNDCNSSTIEKLLDAHDNAQKTISFINSMLLALKEQITYSAIARSFKVSISNVIAHFDKSNPIEVQIDPKSVRNLSIDEVRFVKVLYSNYQCVLMDSDNKKVIDVIWTRHQSVLKDTVSCMFTRLNTITQDLWKPYKTVANNCFPEARIIADPFHVVRQFTWAFSRTRVSIAKNEGVKTNKHWKLLTMRYSKLSVSGKKKLDEILQKNEKLALAHTAKELALEMFSCKDKSLYLILLEIFKKFIDDNELIEFQTAYKSVENWHLEICNMFDYNYSNGAIERVNRTIKQSKNLAFGFKNLARATKLIQYRVN